MQETIEKICRNVESILGYKETSLMTVSVSIFCRNPNNFLTSNSSLISAVIFVTDAPEEYGKTMPLSKYLKKHSNLRKLHYEDWVGENNCVVVGTYIAGDTVEEVLNVLLEATENIYNAIVDRVYLTQKRECSFIFFDYDKMG